MAFADAKNASLLAAEDGPAVEIIGADRSGDVVVCEHAANRIPAALDDLGLDEDALASHIAWDPGALAVAARLADLLDAPLVAARFSRLIYDCNRPPDSPEAALARSEATDVPGNQNLDASAMARRAGEIYRPFSHALSELIESRIAAGARPAIITIHSFTPVYLGVRRETELGILHDDDTRLADAMLERAEATTGLRTARNDPYGPEHGVTHTLKAQALPRGLLNVMLEIRNDLIAETAAQERIADDLAALLRESLAALPKGPPCPDT